MKKFLIVLAFAGVSVASFAQESKYSVATNSFWSNWFVQAGADWNAWYTATEHGAGFDRSPFKKNRSGVGAAVAIGKWFAPEVGVRLKAQGIWGRTITSHFDKDGSFNKYWVANAQVLLNASNIICGYNENRVVNIVPFFGAGLGRTMTHDLYAMDMNVGVQAQFKVTKKFGAYLELGWNRFEGDIDGGAYGEGRRGWDSHDNNVYAEIGLTYNIGKSTWSKVPDVDAINAAHQAAIDALNAKLRDAEAENARLKKLLENQKPQIIEKVSDSVKEFITTPVSVFFNCAKVDVANPKDLVNVRALAKYAKDNDASILVTGYADSSTGTPAINEKLSIKRAETVKNELVGMGVAESKISTDHKGGVNILGVDLPKDFDRRATVQITDVPEKK